MSEIKPIRRESGDREIQILCEFYVIPNQRSNLSNLFTALERLGNKYYSHHIKEDIDLIHRLGPQAILVSKEAIEPLNQLCDDNGRFELEGVAGQVDKVMYSSEVLTYSEYKSIGKPNELLIKTNREIYPNTDATRRENEK